MANERNEIRDHWLKHAPGEVAKSRAIAQKHGWVDRPDDIFVTVPRVHCADGFDMSVQAGYGKYSSPRYHLDTGTYAAWEIGFPSQPEPLILEYAEERERPTDTVYGWVPTEVVNAVIRKHGGLKSEGRSNA